MTIGYRLASDVKDFSQAQALLRSEGFPRQELGFPTVLALDDEVVGFISTNITNNMVVAGPLVMKSDRRRIRTAIRLVEMYEVAMKGLGVKTFIFCADSGGFLEKLIERYGYLPPYAEEDGKKFYIRRL